MVRRIMKGEHAPYRQLRLSALREAPYTFSSRYETAVQRSEASWAEQADSTAEGSDRATFVAFSEDEPVGIAALYRDSERGDTGQVLQVWVAPEQRGTGVASGLLGSLLAWAGENGFQRVEATVRRGNARAARYYHGLGFRLEDEGARGGVCDGVDGLVFVKEILVQAGQVVDAPDHARGKA